MPLFSAEEPVVISLKGYLGKDELSQAVKELEKPSTDLIIEVNSTSGSIVSVIDFAKKIYERKRLQGLRVLVYIDNTALGPAAIIPFLADTLDASIFVSWGDISLGQETVLPPNILRNTVISLIDPNQPKADLLRLMAGAMADPSMSTQELAAYPPLIKTAGATLVVNHNQLKELGLLHEVIPEATFEAKYFPKLHAEKSSEIESNTLVITPTTLEEMLKEHIHYSQDKENVIGRIVIDDRQSGINQSTWLYVRSALEHYQKIKPSFVILELNTPGGEVFAAQKISDALKDLDIQYNIPVVAYINNWAISAGAMLAYSCRFIAVVKDASMGAAEPVIADSSGEMKEASEKVNSALRTDFANRAKFFGRNPLIAEKMVDKDLILVLRHGKMTKVDLESEVKTNGPDPDILISPKGKLLTLNAEDLINYGVADINVPPVKLPQITPEEQLKGEWPASKSPLFEQPFFKSIPNAKINTFQMDWKTYFLYLLSNPIISSVLFLGMIIGGYIELNNPGLTLPGTIAALCLFFIILSSFALDIGNWLEVILLFTGIAIILAELFILPTFGLLGIAGILFFLAGLFGLMLPGIGNMSFDFHTGTWNAAGESFLHHLVWLSATLLIGFGIIALLARYFTRSFSPMHRFVLSGSEQNGYIAGENPKFLPQPGERGETVSPLRPSGKILVKDKIYDAMSAGRFIEKGEPIKIVRLEGSVIIVNEDSLGEP